MYRTMNMGMAACLTHFPQRKLPIGVTGPETPVEDKFSDSHSAACQGFQWNFPLKQNMFPAAYTLLIASGPHVWRVLGD
jgi:hypothetical protein